MKKCLVMLAVFFLCIMGVVTNAKAFVMESVPILIIDGDDSGTTTDILLGDNVVPGFDFGYVDNNGSFVTLIQDGNSFGTHTWNGGEVVDFAIRQNSTNNVYSLGTDSNGNNYATLEFTAEIPANFSQNPVVTENYFGAVTMDWGVPTAIPNYNTTGFNVAMSISNPHDGVAPVPEPATMSLLGMGILGLFGLRKKS